MSLGDVHVPPRDSFANLMMGSSSLRPLAQKLNFWELHNIEAPLSHHVSRDIRYSVE